MKEDKIKELALAWGKRQAPSYERFARMVLHEEAKINTHVEALTMIRDWPVGEKQDWELSARTMVALARKALADAVPTAEDILTPAELRTVAKTLAKDPSIPRSRPASVQGPSDKWRRDELWHSLAKEHNTNAYVVREIVLGYLEATALATPVVQGEPSDDYQKGFADGAGIYRAHAAKAIKEAALATRGPKDQS